jgi:AcrR family transcriptional regulator
VTPTRQRALDAAIDLIGTEGLRSLTHARVDERAGLPKGSTSNYFRTREALTVGVVEWMAHRELAELAPPSVPGSADELVAALVGGVEYATGPNRTFTAARLALFSEAGHNPRVRTAVSGAHEMIRNWLAAMLVGLGAADPQVAATALAACCEGFILHRLARDETADPRPALTLLVRSVLD